MVIALGAFAALSLPVAHAVERSAPFEARVTRVVDGDTIVVESDRGEQRIRLAQIDAPESHQAYGREATQALSELVLDRRVRVEPIDRDRYGRWVAEVYVGSEHVNARMVADGHAWVYRRYAVDRSLDRLEDAARSARAGLWTLPEDERIPPWAWRASRRSAARSAERTEAAPIPTACDGRRTCKEMQSCSEAMFFMKECGLRQLDGDRDGVPCESLCSRLAGQDEE